jgi:hypothetical protein
MLAVFAVVVMIMLACGDGSRSDQGKGSQQ